MRCATMPDRLQVLRVVHLVAGIADPAGRVDAHGVREIDDFHFRSFVGWASAFTFMSRHAHVRRQRGKIPKKTLYRAASRHRDFAAYPVIHCVQRSRTRRKPGGVVLEHDRLVVGPCRRQPQLRARESARGRRDWPDRTATASRNRPAVSLAPRSRRTATRPWRSDRPWARSDWTNIARRRSKPARAARCPDEVDGARVPHRDHVDFGVANKLLRLRAVAPPHFMCGLISSILRKARSTSIG